MFNTTTTEAPTHFNFRSEASIQDLLAYEHTHKQIALIKCMAVVVNIYNTTDIQISKSSHPSKSDMILHNYEHTKANIEKIKTDFADVPDSESIISWIRGDDL